MGKSGQTPAVLIKGGKGVIWDAACRAALIACGINPDNFGSYSNRAAAQRKIRNDYRKQRVADAKKKGKNRRPHEPNCPLGANANQAPSNCKCHESDAGLKDLKIIDWYSANSESGHVSQNALYQGQGERGNPCTNVSPDPSKKHGGTYGYDDKKALCMDHHGKSSDPSTMHYQVCRSESRDTKDLLGKKQSSDVSQAQLKQGVTNTAGVVTTAPSAYKGNDPSNPKGKPGSISPEQKAKKKQADERRQMHAAALEKKENKGKKAGATGTGKGKKPNSPSTKKPNAQQRKKAMECISSAWEQSLDDMRNECINKYSTAGKSAECKKQLKEHNKSLKPGEKKATGYTDLPADRRKKVDDAVNKKDKSGKSKVEKRQEALKKAGADDNGKGLSKKPTAQQCREYQANYLYSNFAVKGKGYPPMQGKVQAPPSDKRTTTKKKKSNQNGVI